jgi:hypothetical protein
MKLLTLQRRPPEVGNETARRLKSPRCTLQRLNVKRNRGFHTAAVGFPLVSRATNFFFVIPDRLFGSIWRLLQQL